MSPQEAVRQPTRGAAGDGPMHANVTLGRVAGVEVAITWSWLIVVAL